MSPLYSFLLSVLSVPSTSSFMEPSSSSSVNISRILNDFQIGYDRRVRPDYGGIPVTVGVSLYILSIGDLSEKFMDFTFDMYFRQFWLDPRLAFERRPTLNKLVVGAEYIKLIWVPDTFFVNEKIALFHSATTENQFLRIMHTGEILRSMRLTIKATCPMNLAHFPFDIQICTVEIESFGYTMSDLKYAWNNGEMSVQMSPDISLPQFNVLGHRQRLVEVSLSSGNYSRLLLDVIFTRSMGYYMIQVYIPSSLIVVMSWVSFWLNRGAAPARVGLGVTTVLTMTTLINSVNAALPKISYMKSIDIYLFVCFFMVFGALIEYACVGYTAKRINLRKEMFEEMQKKVEEKRKELEKNQGETYPGTVSENLNVSQDPYGRRSSVRTPTDQRYFEKKGEVKICCGEARDTLTRNAGAAVPLIPGGQRVTHSQTPDTILGVKASDIDKYSRVVFPIMFLTFHLMYWMIYMSIAGEVPHDVVHLDGQS